ARGQIEVFIHLFGHDQRVRQIVLCQFGYQLFGLRRVNVEGLNHNQTLLTSQLGENATQSSAVHLLVQLDAVIARNSGEGHATGAPQRATGSTGASAASTFLTEWLFATARNLGA